MRSSIWVFIGFIALMYYLYRTRAGSHQRVGVSSTTAPPVTEGPPLTQKRPPPIRVPTEDEVSNIPAYKVKKYLPPLPAVAAVSVLSGKAFKPSVVTLKKYIVALRDMQLRMNDQLLDANFADVRSDMADVEAKSQSSNVIYSDAEQDYYTVLVLAHEHWKALEQTEAGRKQLQQMVLDLD
jgi:hypothetical protein